MHERKEGCGKGDAVVAKAAALDAVSTLLGMDSRTELLKREDVKSSIRAGPRRGRFTLGKTQEFFIFCTLFFFAKSEFIFAIRDPKFTQQGLQQSKP